MHSTQGGSGQARVHSRFPRVFFIANYHFSHGDHIIIRLIHSSVLEIFTAFLSALLGTLLFGAFAMGYLRRGTRVLEWILLGIGTFLLYWPSFETDLAGLLVAVLVCWLQRDVNYSTPKSPSTLAA